MTLRETIEAILIGIVLSAPLWMQTILENV